MRSTTTRALLNLKDTLCLGRFRYSRAGRSWFKRAWKVLAIGQIDPNAFKPGPEMTDAGESFTLSGTRRFPMRVDPSDSPTSTYFQPVIVHATLDAQEGRVIDAEALQNSNQELSRAALQLVRSTSFQATGFQQEVFINVQFHLPAKQVGGVPVFRSSVHWVIWEHRGKAAPRKPGRDAV